VAVPLDDWRRVDWSPFLDDPGRAGLFTDFDGTLAPVVEDRDQARPLPGVAEALSALAGRWSLVAVVSGRPVQFLLRHFSAIANLELVGVHGLERANRGRVTVLPDAEKWRPVISEAVAEARSAVPDGVEVEDKGISMVLHCRRAPSTFPWTVGWADSEATSTGLVARRGRLSVELLPPVPVDKGAVVEELGAGLSALCYLGDDTSDLPAFEALHHMRGPATTAVAVGVGSAEQPVELTGEVDVLLPGPADALELLRALGR